MDRASSRRVTTVTIVIAVREAPPPPLLRQKDIFAYYKLKKIFWIFWLTLFSWTLFSRQHFFHGIFTFFKATSKLF